MPTIYRRDLTVPEAALDGNGHVNNVEYLRWMQDTATAHAETQGGAQAARDAGATWVVRAHRIEYFRPAFAGDRLAVLTWVANFRRVFSTRKFRVFRVEDGALLAAAETDYVFIDARTGRSRSIPPEVAGLFELVPVNAEPAELAQAPDVTAA